MTDQVIAAIKTALNRGERVELIPQKDGAIKVVRIRRENIQTGGVNRGEK